jgi:general nucleoside transport system permease protein
MFLHEVLQNAGPYILAAMGSLITARAGVINIALEGLMLVGALAAVVVASYSGSWAVGLLGAVVIDCALVAVMAIFHLYLGANIILVGFALNLIASGGTVFCLYVLTGQVADSSSLASHPMPTVRLPAIDRVPYLQALSGQSPVTYMAVISLPVMLWFFYRTRTGIHVRAAGESESALVEAGLFPQRIKFKALLLSGALCALAGSQLSMDTTTSFVRDMTQGRGFIALGAVYLGALSPVGTYIASFIFGIFDSLATVLQVRTTIPTELLLAIPYTAALTALVLSGARRRYPRSPLFMLVAAFGRRSRSLRGRVGPRGAGLQ